MLNKHHPRALKFPKPNVAQPRHWERRRNGAYVRVEAATYFGAVNRWLIRYFFRILLDQQREARAKGLTFSLPSLHTLQLQMTEAVMAKAKLGNRHVLRDEDDVTRLVEGTEYSQGAAAFVLENFDFGYLDHSAAMGRKATHRRRFTPSMLKPLKGLSKTQQATALKASTATVAILRRVLKLRDHAIAAKPIHVPAEGFAADLLAILDGQELAPIKLRAARDGWHPTRLAEAVAS